jgi:hypothetical protein
MAPLGHIAGDRNIVGFIDQQARPLLREEFADLKIGGVSADDSMRSKLKDVSRPGDWRGVPIPLERPVIQPLGHVA